MTESQKPEARKPRARKNVGTPGAPTVSGPEARGTEAATATETEAAPTSERGAFPKAGPVAFYLSDDASTNPDDATRRLGETQHNLSYLAGYTSSRTIRDAGGPGRVPKRDLLAAILAETGLASEADLYRNEWTFVLPQTGRIVAVRRIEGRDGFAEPEAAKPTAKPRTRKVASSATAKPTAPAGSRPAKRAARKAS